MSHENGLFIKLYLDEDVHPDLAEMVRSKGFDCTSAAEAGTCGRTDPEQLEYAATEGRCILSFNVPDFAVLATTWAAAGRHHSGIAVTHQVSRNGLGKLLARIPDFLNNTTADEMRDTFRYL
jgi:predicted nuclease of predicted toxin-antitoxin system